MKYKNVKVRLSGKPSNAVYMLGACNAAAKKAGIPDRVIKEFLDEAKSGDYQHLLDTCIDWFDVQ